MAKDVFGRLKMEHGGSFSADAAAVHLVSPFDPNAGAGGLSPISPDGAGLITQQIGTQYQQPITRIYEIGSRKTYYVIGRPSGSMTMARILGPRRVMIEFYQVYGDACLADQNNLAFIVGAGCDPDVDTSNSLVIEVEGVVIQSISQSVRAEDMLVSEQLGMMFINMSMREELAAVIQMVVDPITNEITPVLLGETVVGADEAAGLITQGLVADRVVF